MNSLPSLAANIDSIDHPALESIAAYLDGRLPKRERSEIAAHLDRCPVCYEIYTESFRFQKEESAEARRAELPFEPRRTSWAPSRRFRTLALPLAALLFLGIGVMVWRRLHAPLEAREVASLTASLGNPDGPMTENLGPFDVQRGGEEEPAARGWVVAFQSGATLVDLRLSIEANDSERIRDFSQYLGVLFGYASYPLETDKALVLAAVTRFQADPPRPNLQANLRARRIAAFNSLEKVLRSNNEEDLAPHFQLGVWTEAGRLATYGERAAFFADPKNRQSLGWFRHHPPKPEVKPALQKIEEAWPERGGLNSTAKAELSRQFHRVIDPYDVSLTDR